MHVVVFFYIYKTASFANYTTNSNFNNYYVTELCLSYAVIKLKKKNAFEA